ncbi:hypothetical protein LR48_Vigan09g099100 [Vigna angularis]|uniref:Uncharacterized protein n=1 Tax=Phaseolus angularis TaxID=3914 RepID=A0A0L9VBL4_PHAAN|nr:hypothetical protein LR48_Vigan09g099100 [Vigna angularis]
MAESPHSSGDEVPTTSTRTRGATRLRELILRRNAGERTPVIIDVVTRVASGPNADIFRSYLGVLARDRISILTPSFDHVSEADRNLIWQDLLIGQEGSPPPKKTHLSEDDPLGALDELGKIISDVPMNVHWDSTTFGREAQIPLYLHNQDVRELASGREEINITLIQLWMMYMFDVSNKKGFNDVYGFIDPSMTHEINKFDDIQTYITTCFGMGKEIYFLPYIHGSLATHMMLSGRSTATAKKLAWVALKRFNRTAPIPEKSLQLVRKTLAKYVIYLYNSM